jgi:hypothetical protein
LLPASWFWFVLLGRRWLWMYFSCLRSCSCFRRNTDVLHGPLGWGCCRWPILNAAVLKQLFDARCNVDLRMGHLSELHVIHSESLRGPNEEVKILNTKLMLSLPEVQWFPETR